MPSPFAFATLIGGSIPRNPIRFVSMCRSRFHSALGAIIVVVAIAVTATAQTSSSGSEDVDQLLARGMELHRAGDLLGAVQNYQIALESDPDRADIRSNLGAAYVALGRFNDGIAEYRKALAVQDDATIRQNLGIALYKAGRMNDAIPEFERVLQADTSNRPAALLMADALLQTGRDQQAVDVLTPRESAFEDDLAYAYVLGTALLNLGDTQRGQVLIDRIFKNGESAEGHLLMGIAQLSKRDYAAAQTELKRAIELNPDLPSVQMLYGRVQLGLGDREAAIRAFKRELEHYPNSFQANLQLGTLDRIDQRFDQALLHLQRAADLQPDDVAVRHNLAATYLGMGDAGKALGLLEGVVRDAPDYIDAHVLLATTYYRLKRKDDGDRERKIVERLTAEAQAKQPGARAAEPVSPAAQPPGTPPSDSQRN